MAKPSSQFIIFIHPSRQWNHSNTWPPSQWKDMGCSHQIISLEGNPTKKYHGCIRSWWLSTRDSACNARESMRKTVAWYKVMCFGQAISAFATDEMHSITYRINLLSYNRGTSVQRQGIPITTWLILEQARAERVALRNWTLSREVTCRKGDRMYY